MRDERYFTNPSLFYPDRHLSRVGKLAIDSLQQFHPDDPSSLAFGFGRRLALVLPNSVYHLNMLFFVEFARAAS